MALTQQSLEAGRKGLNKLFFIEAENVPPQFKDVVGRIEDTTETFVRKKQLAGLSPSVQTQEGQKVAYDDMYPLFTRDYAPVLFTKGIKFSEQTKFTDQYGAVAKLQPAFARAFMAKKNQVAANVDNLGFTDTTYGMNAEVLYSTSHSMGTGVTGSNRPATDVAFGPLALEQGLIEIRKQKSARGIPMPYNGKVLLKIAADQEPLAYRILRSMQLQGTNNNDTSGMIRERVEMAVNDYYTNAAYWFLRALDNASHGLFGLMQMAYDMMQLPMDDELMHKWIARESYLFGWEDWHGTWGTVGA